MGGLGFEVINSGLKGRTLSLALQLFIRDRRMSEGWEKVSTLAINVLKASHAPRSNMKMKITSSRLILFSLKSTRPFNALI